MDLMSFITNRFVPGRRFGRQLRILREEQGLTQEELAEKVKISRAYMGFIEQGRESPSLKLLMKISRKFGVKVEELFHR